MDNQLYIKKKQEIHDLIDKAFEKGLHFLNVSKEINIQDYPSEEMIITMKYYEKVEK